MELKKMDNGNKEYGLIRGHIRSIETLLNKIPEKDHLSKENRCTVKHKLADLESEMSEFKNWNEPRK